MTQVVTQTPSGPFRVLLQDGAVIAADWEPGETTDTSDLGKQVYDQLAAYFTGSQTSFDLPVNPRASPFQKQFYDVLSAIPYGETREYGDIAKQMGASAQAIGQACGANPIPVLIPCHRVLGASGLGGFSAKGGVETKVMLLRLEGAASLLI